MKKLTKAQARRKTATMMRYTFDMIADRAKHGTSSVVPATAEKLMKLHKEFDRLNTLMRK